MKTRLNGGRSTVAPKCASSGLNSSRGNQFAFGALELEHPVIDLNLRIPPQRATEIALLRRYDNSMIVGELLEGIAYHAIDPRIPDMKNMRGRGLNDHHAQGAHVPLVFIIWVLASAGLGMEPGVGCRDDALRRGLYRPGFRRAVVIRKKAFDGRLTRYPADIAAADTVGQGNGDAFQAERRSAARNRPVR